MNVTSIRIYLLPAAALIFALAGITTAAAQPTLQAALEPANDRKAAPAFALKDGSGKTISLEKYRGKVLLLDFWATWCTGCKKEIPWFTEFEKTYGANGFAVVGVSMDQEGWKVLRPFLAEHHVPYPMVLGDEATATRYGIENLPDTFLIDRKGRVAAAYRAVLVDKDDVGAKLKTLLAER